MAQRHIMPTSATPVMNLQANKLSPEYHRYLGGIEELSKRVGVNVAPLGVSPTVEQIAIAFNALLDALQDANLQEPT